ncbi:MAG: VOC family protein [Ignavibacterium album]|uniref:VOC family protein n=1 Tax=Ignavibacterium album TaxID=591197 RepID=UPI0026ED578C|nr:VOC family protein [Ignavibacterium album]MCX8107159.1 VOC family protein [Ignavibacterium album]
MAEPLIGHVEIPSIDLERSKDFYHKVFGWDFKPFGNGYLLYNNHKGIMVGLRQVDKVSIGDTTVFHVNIPEINSILEKVKANGGAVKRTKTTIPAMGWYALFTDPDGNTIGLYQKS